VPPAVLLDTDVWSHLFGVRRVPTADVQRWRRLLLGRPTVISVQTRAEVTSGVLQKSLGPVRAGQILGQLHATFALPIDDEIADVCARLTAETKRIGHALHAKEHTGDRWIAATAIRWELPLLARDGIYRHAPGLRLLDDEETGD